MKRRILTGICPSLYFMTAIPAMAEIVYFIRSNKAMAYWNCR